ncbi:MAG: hypothetical protein CMJ72_08990 [Planctomycetaceae bacterium]|nr:hypothetical protein [Planctomycetaceae bacterium]
MRCPGFQEPVSLTQIPSESSPSGTRGPMQTQAETRMALATLQNKMRRRSKSMTEIGLIPSRNENRTNRFLPLDITPKRLLREVAWTATLATNTFLKTLYVNPLRPEFSI